MADNKDYLTFSEEQGQIKISEDVVAAIAGNTAAEIDGVVGLYTSYARDFAEMVGKKGVSKGVNVKFNDDGLELDVFIVTEYGFSIAEVGKTVQHSVKAAVESTTGVNVSVVNVNVCGVAENK